MYITIYFGNKPVFLCDKITPEIEKYRHHSAVIYIDEISSPAIKSLIHEMTKPQVEAAIVFHKEFEKVKKIFFSCFHLIQTGGGLITNNENEILLIFRRGKWDLPKGKLNKGETLEQCAIREAEEETGLAGIKLRAKLMITYHTYEEYGKHILKESHWFAMKYFLNEKPVPQTEEDITDIIWVKQTDLKQYTTNTFPTIITVLDSLYESV